MSGWFGRLFGGLFAGKKLLSTSAALMTGAPAQAMTAPPSQSQKPAKTARVADAAKAAVKPPEKAATAAAPLSEEAGETVEATPAKKAAKKRAPRKRKAADLPAAVEADVEEVLTRALSVKEVAAQFAPARSTEARSTERDVWFSDAVAWSLSGEWSPDRPWSPPPSSEGPKRLEEFREKAAEGKLVIWGRAGDVGLWEPIEANYWRSCGIEQFSFLEGREKVFTEPKTQAKPKPGKTKSAAKYTALMVNKRQVEEVWHANTMH